MQNAILGARARLVELMSWVELIDAAQYLSELLHTAIGQNELLRLALEGHLTLSVRFLEGVTVQRGTAMPLTEDRVMRVPMVDGDGFLNLVNGTLLPGGEQVVVFEEKIVTISDVWDLPMIGGERHAVEDMYETLQARPGVEVIDLEGAFVASPDGTCCKLMQRFEGKARDPRKPYEPRDYYPAAWLPEDAVLVARPAYLRAFAAKFRAQTAHAIEPAPQPKPLGKRERDTLLTLVAALSEMARVDFTRVSAAATAIETQTELMGARVAARTIEEHLKRIPEALENRSP